MFLNQELVYYIEMIDFAQFFARQKNLWAPKLNKIKVNPDQRARPNYNWRKHITV